MKKCVLVLLVVLLVSAIGGPDMASAQGGTQLKAITLKAVVLYAGPDAGADEVAQLGSNRLVTVLGTDETGNWLKIAAREGEGFAPIDHFLVLDLPLLAEQAVVTTRRGGGAGLFAAANFGSDLKATLPDGTVVTVLGTTGEWVFVVLADGTTGWAIEEPFAPLPADTTMAVVSLSRNPELGVFAQALAGSDLVATIKNGTMVYILGEPAPEWVEIQLLDGTHGFALADKFVALPDTLVEAEVSRAVAGLYAAPDFAADLLGEVPNGTALTFLEVADDFWLKLFHPEYGEVYGLKLNFGNAYGLATVQQPGALVRQGPNDAVYSVVAQLDAGTQVIVLGRTDNGAWIQIAIPFGEVDFARNGVNGWMRDFLFVDDFSNSDLNADLLAVTG